MSYWLLYLILHVSDFISLIFGVLFVFGILFFLITGIIIWYDDRIDDDENARITSLKKYGLIWLVIVLILGLVPSKNTTIEIIGAHYITNNEDLSQLPDDITKLLRKYINEHTK